MSASALYPTLWRTCRAIANRRRLRLFGWLVHHPDQTVSTLARQLGLPLSLTSAYLRVLEARGLLTASRVGRFVKYRAGSATAPPRALELGTALRAAFQEESRPAETIFKLATAFTHPRRIKVFRALHQRPCSAAELRAATGVSGMALWRHVSKLVARGLVVRRGSRYAMVEPRSRVGRELARWAIEEGQDTLLEV